MAVIRPFRAVRPLPELAGRVAALPYDVMSSDEARVMVQDNPYSFLHVDKAEIDLEPDIDLYDPRVYAQARENLQSMMEKGVLVEDERPCLYVYRQVMGDRAQTGLVACASIDDYLNNVIKKHELTRADKELDRTRHVDSCDANTGPIFLTYPAEEEINAIVAAVTSREPRYDFVADDGIGHIVWIIEDATEVKELVDLFARIKSLYIADGHHRTASAARVGQMRRQAKADYHGEEEFNYFLVVIFPDQDLHIMDYNRVVQDLNGLSREEFMYRLAESFHIEKHTGTEPYKPGRKHQFGMYLMAEWYVLEAREGSFEAADPVARLDVSILQERVLDPILGIADPRTDNRIDFIGGIRGLQELENRVNEGMAVAFSMYPTTIRDLMDIADADLIMPPKSTWFEPKLRSGLFIHKLS